MLQLLAEAILQLLLELVGPFIFNGICYGTGAFLTLCISLGRWNPADRYLDQQALEKGYKKKNSWIYNYQCKKYLSVDGVSTVGFSFWLLVVVITVWIAIAT